MSSSQWNLCKAPPPSAVALKLWCSPHRPGGYFKTPSTGLHKKFLVRRSGAAWESELPVSPQGMLVSHSEHNCHALWKEPCPVQTLVPSPFCLSLWACGLFKDRAESSSCLYFPVLEQSVLNAWLPSPWTNEWMHAGMDGTEFIVTTFSP